MTKQFLCNNLTFIIAYNNGQPDDFVPGYKIQQKDASIDWANIKHIVPSMIQHGSRKLQKIVNKFYDQTECGWEEYLDKLVKDKQIQDVPETFCW